MRLRRAPSPAGRAKRLAALALACLLAFAFEVLAKRLPARPIDLNRATLEQLEELPGVGPSMARRILAFRQKSGRFRSIEELRSIRGIGDRRFEKIRPYVFVAQPPGKTTSPRKRT